jgi:hypothetical protein
MKEITRAINENRYAPEKKWQYETIEFIESLDTMYGTMDKYEITVRFKASKYDDNGIKYQINHYVDEDAYGCYWNGTCYLG